jgi:hypothetical protein
VDLCCASVQKDAVGNWLPERDCCASLVTTATGPAADRGPNKLPRPARNRALPQHHWPLALRPLPTKAEMTPSPAADAELSTMT